MMDGLRAVRATAVDFWDRPSVVLLYSLLCGIICLFGVTIPFAVALTFAVANEISAERPVELREVMRRAWRHSLFFYRWFFVFLLPTLFLGAGIFTYRQSSMWWAQLLAVVGSIGLVIWLLPQPLIPALYWHQDDIRLKTIFRNAFVIAAKAPFGLLVVWLVALFVSVSIAFANRFLLLALPMIWGLLFTRIVSSQIS